MNVEEALGEFILAGKANLLRPATLKWYSSLLNAFVVKFPAKELDSITAKDIRHYIVELQERPSRYVEEKQKPAQPGGLAHESIRGHITALKAFWAWCADEYEVSNPMARIRRPKRVEKRIKAITSADFVKVFDTTTDDEIGKRNRAILVFLADTGCRLGGIANLRLDNLFLDEQRAIVFEKGDKSRMIFFKPEAKAVLEQWLNVRLSDSPYVFTNKHGERLTESGLYQVLKRLKIKAGVTGRMNPHGFRHNFAREWIRAGGSLATLAMVMGNSIEAIIDYYGIFAGEEIAEQHDKYSPLNVMR